MPLSTVLLFLSVAGSAYAGLRRIRRELRTLTSDERACVFDALDIMKNTSGEEGRHQFGSNFASYDELVAQHLKAAAHRPCDAAHLGPAFATFHRAFTLQFEESLLAIDSTIGAMPYWDYNVEAAMEDPRSSELWKWFGSSEGDPSNGHAVRDGRFGHWKVRSTASDISELYNSYGLLRSPWNVNPSPYITRYRFSCGSQTHFNTEMWNMCLKLPNYVGWYACVDPMVHTWSHSFIGGIWDTARNESRIECYVENAMAVPVLWEQGCFDCDTNCSIGGKQCSCTKSSKLQCLADKLLPGHKAPTYGDFADSWASPNDPIFFFHHANVDRHLMTWQQRHREHVPSYNFPSTSIPCEGHGLHDVVSPDVPFRGSLLNIGGADKVLTNADIISADGLSDSSIYTYDTLRAHFVV